MAIKEQLKRLETSYKPKTRNKAPLKEALNKLEKAGRKREGLKPKDAKKSIPSILNVGKDQGGTSSTSSGEIEYKKTTVTSSDGIFVFEVMVDKALIDD